MDYVDIEANDPFEFRERRDALIIKTLKAEVLRLKIKCKEQLTEANLMGEFGQPMAFNAVRPKAA